MADPVYPPDLASTLGAPQEPQTPTRSTLPESALTRVQQPDYEMGLLRALAPSQMAPNPGMAMGSGMIAGLAGQPTRNPYIEGFQAQQDRDFQQQTQQARLASQIIERRRRAQEAQQAAADQLIDGLKDSDSPQARAFYSREMALRGQRYGLKLAPDFFFQSAKLGKDEVEAINLDIAAELSVPEIMARHPKLQRMPPGWLDSQMKLVAHPTASAKMGFKSRDELRADVKKRADEQLDRDLKRFRTLNPEVTDEQAPHVFSFFRSQTGGLPQDVDTSTPQGRALLAQGRAHADRQIELAKERETKLKTKGEAAPKLSDENSARQQYNTLTKDTRTIIDSYRRITEASADPSAAGDLALIFNYMKMLDPGSVVRESEFANAAATGGWGERLKAAGQRLLAGERLSDEMRRDFVKQAHGQFVAQRRGYIQTEKEYRRLAEASGMDPDRVVPDYLGDLRDAKPGAPGGPLNPTPRIPTSTPATGILAPAQVDALKRAGYTDAQINAYKRAKGLR